MLNSLVIEHDESLSRNEIFFGNNYSFNRKIWSSVAAYFTHCTISIQTAADARKSRLQAAAEVNPAFNLNADSMQASMIETALYLSVFGDVDEGNAVTRWVRVMFGKPVSARTTLLQTIADRASIRGRTTRFRRSEEPITISQLVGLAEKVAAASA